MMISLIWNKTNCKSELNETVFVDLKIKKLFLLLKTKEPVTLKFHKTPITYWIDNAKLATTPHKINNEYKQ